MSVWVMFNNCGWLSYVMVLVSLVSLPVSLVALILAFATPRVGRIVAVLSLVLGMLNFTMGAFVELRTAMTCDESVREMDIDPSYVHLVKEEMIQEASSCTKIGLILSSLPTLMSAVGVVAAWTLHRRARERELLTIT